MTTATGKAKKLRLTVFLIKDGFNIVWAAFLNRRVCRLVRTRARISRRVGVANSICTTQRWGLQHSLALRRRSSIFIAARLWERGGSALSLPCPSEGTRERYTPLMFGLSSILSSPVAETCVYTDEFSDDLVA
jgi:hypothetical protein